jgi:hypothetical protein
MGGEQTLGIKQRGVCIHLVVVLAMQAVMWFSCKDICVPLMLVG